MHNPAKIYEYDFENEPLPPLFNVSAIKHRLLLFLLAISGTALVVASLFAPNSCTMHLGVEAGVGVLLFWAIEVAVPNIKTRRQYAFLISFGIVILCLAYHAPHWVSHEETSFTRWLEVTLIAIGVSVFIAIGLESLVKAQLHHLNQMGKDAEECIKEAQRRYIENQEIPDWLQMPPKSGYGFPQEGAPSE